MAPLEVLFQPIVSYKERDLVRMPQDALFTVTSGWCQNLNLPRGFHTMLKRDSRVTWQLGSFHHLRRQQDQEPILWPFLRTNTVVYFVSIPCRNLQEGMGT